MKQLSKLCCALLIMSLAVGCSKWQMLTTLGLGAAGAGVAAVYYAKGDLEADIDHDINHVYKATLLAMEKRNYNVTDKKVDDSSGRIDADIPAEMGDKKQDLTIKLKRKGDNRTHIFIRVGIFGDESLSRTILQDIQLKL